jgi:phosphate-selective porin OprO/OprP
MASDVPFVERSLANNVVPARDVGLMLLVGPGRQGVEAEIGVFNGAADNASIDSNSDDALEGAGRIFYQPFQSRPRSPLQGLGIGIAGTTGHNSESLSALSFRTAGRSVFFRYSDGVRSEGERTRLSPQFFLYHGSLGVLGETFSTRQRLRKSTSVTTAKLTGFNLQATYVLTGENASFRGVVPRQSFDPLTGHGGAVEVALRYSRVRANTDLFRQGFTDGAVSAEKADAYTAGVNWYLNRQIKAQLNYEYTRFGSPLRLSSGTRQQEDVFLTQFQISF